MSTRYIKYSQQPRRLLGTAKYLIIPSSRTHLGLAFGLKSDTARCTQQCRRNNQAGSPNVGRQLQDTETGYGWKVAIIRKKSLAAGCQCRNNLERIRRLDSRCGSKLCSGAQMISRNFSRSRHRVTWSIPRACAVRDHRIDGRQPSRSKSRDTHVGKENSCHRRQDSNFWRVTSQ